MNSELKICVYAICKNESKFVDRWVDSIIDEADYIVVLDTGSTDDTVERLKKYLSVQVEEYDYEEVVGYFRFDTARNDSLKLVPFDADICVVLDFDQVPEKGWSDIIRNAFANGYNEVRGFIVDHDDNGNEISRWCSRNVHPNSPEWYWERMIHEGIKYIGDGEPKSYFSKDFVINHYPDRSKDRSGYIKLLEKAVSLYPKDPYYGIYYGVELAARYSKDDAIDQFLRCVYDCKYNEDNLNLKYQCFLNIASLEKDKDDMINYALRYLHEADKLGMKTRRYYWILADVYERMDETDKAMDALRDALSQVPVNSNDWRDDADLFSGKIEDRLSLFYYYQKHNYPKALEYCAKALSINPYNNRIQENLKYYYDAFMKSVKEKCND